MKNWRNEIKFRASTKVSDKDMGMEDLLRKIDGMQKGEVFVGITEESGQHGKAHIPVLQLANIHEFGLGVPERSFIRGWQASYEPVSRQKLAATWQKVIARQISTSQALTSLGKEFLFDARNYFVTHAFTPLSQVTINKKGHDKALIETGQMFSSLTFHIKLGTAMTAGYTKAVSDFREGDPE